MKPTPDALAAGIFGDENQDPRAVARFAFDDSNFTYLFVHRLPDAPTLDAEGPAVVLSGRRSR